MGEGRDSTGRRRYHPPRRNCFRKGAQRRIITVVVMAAKMLLAASAWEQQRIVAEDASVRVTCSHRRCFPTPGSRCSAAVVSRIPMHPWTPVASPSCPRGTEDGHIIIVIVIGTTVNIIAKPLRIPFLLPFVAICGNSNSSHCTRRGSGMAARVLMEGGAWVVLRSTNKRRRRERRIGGADAPHSPAEPSGRGCSAAAAARATGNHTNANTAGPKAPSARPRSRGHAAIFAVAPQLKA